MTKVRFSHPAAVYNWPISTECTYIYQERMHINREELEKTFMTGHQ